MKPSAKSISTPPASDDEEEIREESDQEEENPEIHRKRLIKQLSKTIGKQIFQALILIIVILLFLCIFNINWCVGATILLLLVLFRKNISNSLAQCIIDNKWNVWNYQKKN